MLNQLHYVSKEAIIILYDGDIVQQMHAQLVLRKHAQRVLQRQ